MGSGKVKVEEEESPLMEMDMGRDDQSFELSFDYETCEEVKEMKCLLDVAVESVFETRLKVHMIHHFTMRPFFVRSKKLGMRS